MSPNSSQHTTQSPILNGIYQCCNVEKLGTGSVEMGQLVNHLKITVGPGMDGEKYQSQNHSPSQHQRQVTQQYSGADTAHENAWHSMRPRANSNQQKSAFQNAPNVFGNLCCFKAGHRISNHLQTPGRNCTLTNSCLSHLHNLSEVDL